MPISIVVFQILNLISNKQPSSTSLPYSQSTPPSLHHHPPLHWSAPLTARAAPASSPSSIPPVPSPATQSRAAHPSPAQSQTPRVGLEPRRLRLPDSRVGTVGGRRCLLRAEMWHVVRVGRVSGRWYALPRLMPMQRSSGWLWKWDWFRKLWW